MGKGKYAGWVTDDGIAKIEHWARIGLSDTQIAENIGIRRETLYEWMKRFPNINDTIKRGRLVPIANVENSVYRAALGYMYEEAVEDYQMNADGEEILVSRRVYRKFAQPNPTMAIFYLKQRDPDNWNREPSQILNDEDVTGVIEMPMADSGDDDELT